MMKLELAIRKLSVKTSTRLTARGHFERLAAGRFKHSNRRKKGKSRSIFRGLRLLALPEKQALSAGNISEGHTRPILMLSDRH